MNLHPSHLNDLRNSGLSDVSIQMMGVESLTPADINTLLPVGFSDVESVLKFPYFGVNGFCRYKLFPPVKQKQGQSMRYFQPKDSGCHLYILPQVGEKLADLSAPLAIIEGEKKTAAAVQSGLNAIGIGGIWNWKCKESWKGIDEFQRIALADRELELIFDSDTWSRDDLQQAVYAFGRYLEWRGAKVIVCLIPQPGTEKVGLDDYLLTHSIDDFKQLKRINLKHAALARQKIWYEDWRKKGEEAREVDDALQGRPLALTSVEPWADPVDGIELLIHLCQTIRRYVVMEYVDVVATALWCIHAHAIDAFAVSPFLNPSSPEMGCGKSTTLTLISYLVPRPLLSGNMSSSSIFRAIEKYKPTFLIDEADTFENLNEELRGILNASHLRASAHAIRTVGQEHEPRLFSTWCPKAVALIGRLPLTLEDRSIVINLRRRKLLEKCEPFSQIDPHPELQILCRKISWWAKDNFQALRQSRPAAPDGLENRVYDNWRPLLAIADAVGGNWPAWARAAAQGFINKAREDSIKVELLRDIEGVMTGLEKISSKNLVSMLGEMAEKPWSAWKHGKPLNEAQLARMLKPFGIKPRTIRVGDETAKGYHFEDFEDAVERYASRSTTSETSHESQADKISNLAGIFEPSQNCSVTASKDYPTVRKDDDVTRVTFRNTEVRQAESNGRSAESVGGAIYESRRQR